MVLLNLLVGVEAAITMILYIILAARMEIVLFWGSILVLTIVFAELALHERFERLARALLVYGTTFVLLPVWALVYGCVALISVFYVVTILFALNVVATRLQRFIINPVVAFFMIGVMGHEYYAHNYLVIMPIEGDLVLYYIIITPLALMLGMGVVVYMTDRYKHEHQLLEEKNEELQQLMRIDTLTGLYNKKFLNEQLKVLMALSRRDECPLSILVIDIDFFKNYNDMYGHIQGDQCLVEVSEIINHSVLRQSDSVFRFGGEEFVVLLYNVGSESGEIVGQRIVDNVREARIKHIGSEIAEFITVSAGLFTYDGKKDMTTNSVIRMGDEALYMAKKGGRDQICTLYV